MKPLLTAAILLTALSSAAASPGSNTTSPSQLKSAHTSELKSLLPSNDARAGAIEEPIQKRQESLWIHPGPRHIKLTL